MHARPPITSQTLFLGKHIRDSSPCLEPLSLLWFTDLLSIDGFLTVSMMVFSWWAHLVLCIDSTSFVPGSTGTCPWYHFEIFETMSPQNLRWYSNDIFPSCCISPMLLLKWVRTESSLSPIIQPMDLQVDWEFMWWWWLGAGSHWSSEPLLNPLHDIFLLLLPQ